MQRILGALAPWILVCFIIRCLCVDQLEELSLLFQNLQSMKNEISSLSGAEKLNKAETVVKAFWNAVGGDSDEFSDSKSHLF